MVIVKKEKLAWVNFIGRMGIQYFCTPYVNKKQDRGKILALSLLKKKAALTIMP